MPLEITLFFLLCNEQWKQKRLEAKRTILFENAQKDGSLYLEITIHSRAHIEVCCLQIAVQRLGNNGNGRAVKSGGSNHLPLIERWHSHLNDGNVNGW